MPDAAPPAGPRTEERRPAVNTLNQLRLMQTRRQFFGAAGFSLGTAALASLLGQDADAAAPPARAGAGALPGLPHFPAKVKRVVYLHMGGAPSHVDLFDYKPELERRRGEELPESVHKGQ